MGVSTVKDGAVLVCSLGSASSILKVPVCHGVSSQGGNQANVADSVGGLNIISFCKCSRQIPPVPCTPQTQMKWLKGQKNRILDDERALLMDCIVPCIYGGIISITNSGQK